MLSAERLQPPAKQNGWAFASRGSERDFPSEPSTPRNPRGLGCGGCQGLGRSGGTPSPRRVPGLPPPPPPPPG
ncbi:unnamed protein product, partial [Bubo scandiacus]